MQSVTQTAPVESASLRAGGIPGGLMAWFMLFGGIIPLLRIDPVVKTFAELRLPPSIAVPIGIVELFCVLLYVIPSASRLEAVWLTGYFGGASAARLRVGRSIFGRILFPVSIGSPFILVCCWGRDFFCGSVE